MDGNYGIWLKPKPEQIDENFEEFLKYISNPADKNSDLYKESVKLLDERVKVLLQERFELPAYRHPRDLDSRWFNVRLCGAWLLLNSEADYDERKLVLLTMINNVTQYCLSDQRSGINSNSFASNSIDLLVDMGMKMMIYSIPTFNLTWRNITKDSFDVFLHNFLNLEFKELESFSTFEQHGCITVRNGEIAISPTGASEIPSNNGRNSLVPTKLLKSNRINLFCEKDDHIKESKSRDVNAIEKCINGTVKLLRAYVKPFKKKILKEYEHGDIVPVRVLSMKPRYFRVESVDSDYHKIQGNLEFDSSYYIFGKNYPIHLWQKAINIGDILEVKYNAFSKTFSVLDQFIESIQKYMTIGSQHQCKYYRTVNKASDFYEFVTDEGFIIFSNVKDYQLERLGFPKSLEEYDSLRFIISHHGDASSQYRGCIYGELDKDGAPNEITSFDEQEELQGLINDFIDNITATQNQNANIDEEEEFYDIDIRFIKEYCHTLIVLQSRTTDPYERYKMLGTIRLLGAICDFDRESAYAQYLGSYIKTLIMFAENQEEEGIESFNISLPSGLENDETIKHGIDILKILSCFGKGYSTDTNSTLTAYIHGSNYSLKKTASLVQSYNRLKNVLDAKTLKGIKMQLLRDLSVVTEGDTGMELSEQLEGLFGAEDDMREFKESFFEAPRTAKEQNQSYTIMKCVCGMMNNRGGVLYLGVNDRGIPIGLKRDLNKLRENSKALPNLDHLVLHINRIGEEWLGETIWKYVSIKPNLEYNILSINIEPYPYDAVALKDGKYYLRKNNSTALITEMSTIEDIRRKRQSAKLEIDDKIINLQNAIQQGLCVRLIGYKSSHSQKIENRDVEPFMIDVARDYVMCYEHPKNKMFKISRIERVSLKDEKWKYKSHHKEQHVDVFNMSGEEEIEVTLNLKLRARNSLFEQYVKSEDCLSQIGKDRWQFKAKLHSLKPLVHFYLANADSIEIVSAPGLKEAVEEYIKKYIHKN